MPKTPAYLRCVLFSVVLSAHHLTAADNYQRDVLPLLQRYCMRCHGADKQHGDVRLDTLSTDFIGDAVAAETWHDILTVLHQAEMPPKDERQLNSDDLNTLTGWINRQIDRAIETRKSTDGQSVMRRLNRVEYRNTMQELLGVDLDFGKDLPPDEVSDDGFRNNGSALRMSALQLQTYLAVAREGLSRALVDYDEPTVVSLQATESVADKGKGHWTNRLGRSGVFVARSKEFPDEGEFLIRVTAHAESPLGCAYPQMQVTLGFRADTETPSREVATVDVSNVEPEVFEFRARIEEFPRQSRSQSKYPGLLIWIRNVYSDGEPAPKPKSVVVEAADGKKSKQTVWEEDSEFPKIIIDAIEFKAPVFEHWPPPHHTAIVSRQPSSPDDEAEVANEAIRQFLPRAFRRPVAEATIEAFNEHFQAVRPTLPSFIAALRETLAMALVSPDFLYLSEPAANGKRPLDDYEIASRLSYFLWSSMPDARLFELAQAGRLSEPAVRMAEVNRMLADARSEAFIEQFSDQWLHLDGVSRVAVNPEFYPNFDVTLKAQMRKETQQFFAEVLRNDLIAQSFIDSDFVMLNRPLAEHYGLEGPRGMAFERVSLPRHSHLGGLLTQASILLSGSNGEDSHPILRGVWLRDRLLGDPPAPPPPNVPNLDADNRDFAKLPLKDQLVQHRENSACANCHAGIDPWGLALEQFDAIGKLRDVVKRRNGRQQLEFPVDAAVDLPTGVRIDGVVELKAYLTQHEMDRFSRSLVTKLLSYALGRSLELVDEPTVKDLLSQFESSDYRLKSLVEQIVANPAFAIK